MEKTQSDYISISEMIRKNPSIITKEEASKIIPSPLEIEKLNSQAINNEIDLNDLTKEELIAMRKSFNKQQTHKEKENKQLTRNKGTLSINLLIYTLSISLIISYMILIFIINMSI